MKNVIKNQWFWRVKVKHGWDAPESREKDRRAESERKRRQRLFVHGVLAALALLCALLFLFWQDMLDAWQASETDAKLAGLYRPLATANASPENSGSFEARNAPEAAGICKTENTPEARDAPEAEKALPTPMPVATLPPMQADFQDLYAQNKHIIGWLRAGKGTSEPVVYYDNDYYLHHDFFGRGNRNGTLFLNENNTLFPRDDVLLIHGHNMNSGAMFGKLSAFRDYDYVCKYPLVMFRTIYDAAEVYYAPFAAFDASMIPGAKGYFDITQILFESDDEAAREGGAATLPPTAVASTIRQSAAYQRYLDALREISYWESPLDVNADDEVLMLVTCSYLQEDGRFALVLRKLRENETAREIEDLFVMKTEAGK